LQTLITFYTAIFCSGGLNLRSRNALAQALLLHINLRMKKLSVRGKDHFALRVSSGFNQGALITLSKKNSILGRSFRAAVPLEDEKASREHAKVINRDGQYFVSDLGSTNGTYLNDILLRDERPLHPGDIIRIGSSVFRFEVLRKNSELGEKWKNATSVIPRAHFSFEELSKIQPDRYIFFKKQMKKARKFSSFLHGYLLRELELAFVKIELNLTKLFFKFHKFAQKTRLLK